MKVTVDGYTRVLLSVITVLLAVLAVGMWCESPSTVPSARAAVGIPDSGQQLHRVLEKLDSIDKSIAEMKLLMVSGAVKVQVVESKAAATKAPAKSMLEAPVQK